MILAAIALLVAGTRAEAALAPGEVREFALPLEAGAYARIRVDQVDVDVVVTVVDPEGNAGIELDSAVRAGTADDVHVLAARSGRHLLRVRAYDGSGRFALEVAEGRAATPRDRRLLEAEDLFHAARVARRAPEGRAAAIEGLARALAIYEELGYDLRRADATTYLADTRLADRDAAAAAPLYRSSIPLLESTGQRARAGLSWLSLGHCRDQLSDFGGALEAYERARDLFREIGSAGGLAQALLSLGRIRYALGDFERALALDREAEEAYAAAGPGPGPAIAALNVGRALEASGDLVGAAGAFSRARDLLPRGPRIRRGQAALGLARVERRRGGLDAAAEEISRAERDFHDEGDRRWEAEASRERGELALERSDPAGADAAFRRAVELDRAIGNVAGEAEGRYGIARATRDAGDLDLSRREIESAIAALGGIREGLDDPALRARFAAAHRAYYALLFDLLYVLRRDDPDARAAACFAAAEGSRAQALRDRLRAAGLPQEEVLPAATLDGTKAALAADEMLLEYRIAGDAAYVFAVTRDSVRFLPLEAGAEELAERVGNYLDLLADRRPRDWRSVAAALGTLVLGPAGEIPPTVRHVVVVPDGPLAFLPFETLPLGGAGDPLLLERASVSYAPAASVAFRRSRGGPASPREVWVFAPSHEGRAAGDAARRVELLEREGFSIGALPSARAEARAIARLAGERGRLFLGAAATEARLAEEAIPRAGVLHFATHALVSGGLGERSALLLADDGRGDDGLLEAREIFGLRLADPMVVLSACDTARGRVLEGEGVLGLVEAFLHAGADTVVASLWSLGDRGTSRFMRRYYERLAQGLDARDALREVKLELYRGGSDGSPRVWAPYVLVGDGTMRVPLTPASGSFGEGVVVVLVIAAAAAAVLRFRATRSSNSPMPYARGGST